MRVSRSLLPHKVYIRSREGDSAYGTVWGGWRLTPARVESKITKVQRSIDSSVVEIVCSSRGFLPSGTIVNADDQLMHGDRTYQVVEVLSQYGLASEVYVEVLLK